MDNFLINTGTYLESGSDVFKAPRNGIYDFSFNANSNDGGAEIHILKNNVKKIAFSTGKDKYDSISADWMIQLDEGDQLQLKVVQGSLLVDSNAKCYINGKLFITDKSVGAVGKYKH